MPLQKGDVLCIYSPWEWNDIAGSIIPWLIRVSTRSNRSHVAWVIDDHTVLEALEHGIVVSPISDYDIHDQNKVLIRRVKPEYLTSDQVSKAVDYACLNYKGKPYDTLEILRLLLVSIFRRRKTVPIDSAGKNDTAFICSEEIARALHALYGFLVRDDVPAWQNTEPKDFAVSDKFMTIDPSVGNRQ